MLGERIKKILVVDDEVFICELLYEFLSLQGYQVETANSGEEAIFLFKSNRPQMVLLDIRMPGMDGLDVLRRIKSIDKNAGVVMLSAFGDVDTVQRALQLGAYRYVQKPVELENLQNILSEWQQIYMD